MTDLSVYEFETDPLTVSELTAIHTYESAVIGSGLRDCFDSLDLQHVRWHVTEFGQELTQAMLKEHAGLLNTWYLALDALLGDALTCTSEVTRYSTGAARYVEAAAAEYHRTRQNFEHAVTAWTLGLRVDSADSDYPPPTRAVNLPTQSLTTEA